MFSLHLQLSPAELVAQKRAEIAAKLAGMMKTNPALANIGATSARPPVALAAPVPKVPIVPAVAASKVVFNASPSPTVSSGPTPASGSATPAALPEDLVRRVAEARRRVADAQIKLAVKDNPYMVGYYYYLSPVYPDVPCSHCRRLVEKRARQRSRRNRVPD